MFGGTAGAPYDSCYHKACDTIDNLNMDVFILYAKGVAEAVATFAILWDGIPRELLVASSCSAM